MSTTPILESLTDHHDRAAATAPRTQEVPLTHAEIEARAAAILEARPESGPGVDEPVESERGELPDGVTWDWRVGWNPFLCAIVAEFTLWDKAREGQEAIRMTMCARDVESARIAVRAMLRGFAPRPKL